MFYFEEISGKKVMKSTLLEGLNHIFTTRESFIKTKETEFLSIAEKNKSDIQKFLGAEKMIYPEQTHSANIRIVRPNEDFYPDTDGLILSEKGIAVFLNFADCTPLIFYDEEHGISAVSHAGWRGTASMIGVKTVKMMREFFNSKPENIKCAIGAAISKCCYNVGEDVCRKLISTVKNPEGLYELRNGELYVDLKGINKRQLEDIGVNMIDVCPYCTVCDNDNFFSYRKENGTTNRHSAIIMID